MFNTLQLLMHFALTIIGELSWKEVNNESLNDIKRNQVFHWKGEMGQWIDNIIKARSMRRSRLTKTRLRRSGKGRTSYLVLALLLIYFDVYDFRVTLLNIWEDLDCKFPHFRICARSSIGAIEAAVSVAALFRVYSSSRLNLRLLG